MKAVAPIHFERAKASREASPGYAGHVFRLCDTCGHLSWTSSTNAHEGIRIVWQSDEPWASPCPQCMVIRMRAPEIYLWVCGVANMAAEDAATTETNATREKDPT